MDVALLLILPVIGGYYFANNWFVTRYRSAREDGHRLYFRAVLCGTILFAIAYVLRLWVLRSSGWYMDFESTLRNHLAPFLKSPKDSPAYDGFPLLVTSLYALALGVTAWWLLNLPFAHEWLLRDWLRDWLLKNAVKNDDFERLIHRAMERYSPLSVTIENQKVYVGFVVRTVDPALERKTLRILPVMSGYRRPDGGVEFTTYYERVYDEIERGDRGHLAHLAPEDFEIVLPVERIVSANMFDIVAYEEFGRSHRRRAKKKQAPRSRGPKQGQRR